MQSGPSDTDEGGVFLLEGIGPGTISLSATASGWQTAVLDDLEVPEGEDLEGIELVMEPGAVIEGRVYGPDGEPLPGAMVMIEESLRARARRQDALGWDDPPPGLRGLRHLDRHR